MKSACTGWAIGLGMSLVGCAASVMAPETVRQDRSAAVATVCSPLAQAVAVSRLRQAWQTCVAGGRTPQAWIPVGALSLPVYASDPSRQVIVEDASTQASVILRDADDRILAMADFRTDPASACKTQVTARAGSAGWERFVQHTAAWLAEPGVAGPSEACR